MKSIYSNFYMGRVSDNKHVNAITLKKKKQFEKVVEEVFGDKSKFIACVSEHGKYVFADNIKDIVSRVETVDYREGKYKSTKS